jgi:hypothetical protein
MERGRGGGCFERASASEYAIERGTRRGSKSFAPPGRTGIRRVLVPRVSRRRLRRAASPVATFRGPFGAKARFANPPYFLLPRPLQYLLYPGLVARARMCCHCSVSFVPDLAARTRQCFWFRTPLRESGTPFPAPTEILCNNGEPIPLVNRHPTRDRHWAAHR